MPLFKINTKKEVKPAPIIQQETPMETAAEKNEYIEVEGYKGLTASLTGYGNFQYEIGQIYELDEDPVICEKGFHFCLSLSDVFNYYSPSDPNNRFFKIKALVNQEELKNYGKLAYVGHGSIVTIDKLAAKRIQLVEELPNEEIYTAISMSRNFPALTLEQYQIFKNQTRLNLIEFLKADFHTNLKCQYGAFLADLMCYKISEDKTMSAMTVYNMSKENSLPNGQTIELLLRAGGIV